MQEIRLETFLKKIKMHPYYYVPPCPSCGSRRTGYFLRKSFRAADNDWSVDNALSNGEIISLVDEKGEDDFFCLDCDYTWPGVLHMSLKSREYINNEAKERNTKEILEEIKKDRAQSEKEGGRIKKKGGIGRFLFGGLKDSVTG